MLKRWSQRLALILMSLMTCAGCMETALIGAGATGAMAGYKWMEGTMTREYPRSLPEMEQAVQNVCKQQRITITERRVTPTKASIAGTDATGQDTKITLDAMPNNITSVAVRMGGFMGNKDASELFHNQLAKDLGL